MSKTNYHGIDYGLGMANIDKDTGIRFGVIPGHALNEWWHESFEDEYTPRCPKCGNDAVEFDEEKHGQYKDARAGGWLERTSCTDYACEACEHFLDNDDVYGEEPDGSHCTDTDYTAELHSDGEVFITKSPYYTHAQFCSPCAPGACYLTSWTDTDGPRAYCFGPDWFDKDTPPYPVYKVADGSLVHPGPAQEEDGDATNA